MRWTLLGRFRHTPDGSVYLSFGHPLHAPMGYWTRPRGTWAGYEALAGVVVGVWMGLGWAVWVMVS